MLLELPWVTKHLLTERVRIITSVFYMGVIDYIFIGSSVVVALEVSV